MLPILEVQATGLQILWFTLISVLWIGFFFLEGFDFGVAMNLPIIGKSNDDRRVMINTIGPLWDGNEVWLLTAGGATFAAFPGWYATEFSALYLPLLLVLVGLILRGVAFEYRHKRDSDSWRAMFDWFAVIGSFLPSLVLGVGFANFIKGLPVGQVGEHEMLFKGTFLGLFTPFTLVGGVLFVVLFLAHGAMFLSLKTRGDVRTRSHKIGSTLGVVAAGLLAIYGIWANIAFPNTDSGVAMIPALTWVLMIGAAVAMGAAAMLIRGGKEMPAFISGGLSIVMLIAAHMMFMWPTLGFAHDGTGRPLDATTAASTEGTLTIMTIATVIFLPIVLAYQIWTYWVFRRRIGVSNLPQEPGSGEPRSLESESEDPFGRDSADADGPRRAASPHRG